MILVAIGGQSASGKTSLSKIVQKKLATMGISAQILSIDDYYKERPLEISPEKFREITNFDDPSTSIDWELFNKDFTNLSQGRSIQKPVFVFTSNRREGTVTVNPSQVIIMESIFAQYYYQNHLPKEQAALSINITTEAYLDILERRIKRDKQDQTRIRTEDQIIAHERKFVGPGFFKYTASSAIGSDAYVVNKHSSNSLSADDILNDAADEVIIELMRKIELGDFQRRQTPKAQELVAKSHMQMGVTPEQFKGYHFNGVFGQFKGSIEKEALETLADQNNLSI